MQQARTANLKWGVDLSSTPHLTAPGALTEQERLFRLTLVDSGPGLGTAGDEQLDAVKNAGETEVEGLVL